MEKKLDEIIEKYGQEIMKAVRKSSEPYVRVEIDCDGIKVTQSIKFIPNEIN